MRAFRHCLAAAAVLLLPAPGASAQENADSIEREALSADEKARALSRDADAADARARSARRTRIETGARIQEGERRAAAISARIEKLTEQQMQQRARLAEKQGEVSRLLAALQTLSRRPTGLVLLQPENAVTTARVSALLEAVRPILAARTADLKSDLSETRKLRAAVDQEKAALEAAQASLAQNVARLETLQLEHREERDRLDAEADRERKRAQQLAARAIDLRGLVRAVERAPRTEERSQPRTPLRRRAGAAQSLVDQLGYRFPVNGNEALAFGAPNNAGVRSRGMTISTPDNAQVVAPAGGTVAYAGAFRTYGDIVIVEHDGDWLSMLAGLKRVDVEVGEEVERGSPIGKMGAANPELYLELRRAGRPVDPARYVSQ